MEAEGHTHAFTVIGASYIFNLASTHTALAAMIAFQVFAHPIMLKMLGAGEVLPRPTVRAKAIRRVPSAVGNRTFARVIVKKSDGEFLFEPLRTSGSGVISSMVRANGIVVILENKEGIEEGETVDVTLLKPIEE